MKRISAHLFSKPKDELSDKEQNDDMLNAMNQYREEVLARRPQPLEYCYNMYHKKRGMALIFNHEEFVNQRRRRGTNIDRDRLRKTFKSLDFKVKTYENQTKSEVLKTLQKISRKDHTDKDCLLIVFLTHGELKKFNNDEACDTILNHDLMSHVHAHNETIPVRTICDYFTDVNCPSLANKPRILLIQACQDEKKDIELLLDDEITYQNVELSFPQKDFLMVYSSMPGTKSFRTTGNGSWFVETLCNELNENGQTDDLFGILTRVSLKIAYDYESYEFDIIQKKQIPCVMSRLTKLVFFPKKKSISNKHSKNRICKLFSYVSNSQKR